VVGCYWRLDIGSSYTDWIKICIFGVLYSAGYTNLDLDQHSQYPEQKALKFPCPGVLHQIMSDIAVNSR
jgi:hypothetical protein